MMRKNEGVVVGVVKVEAEVVVGKAAVENLLAVVRVVVIPVVRQVVVVVVVVVTKIVERIILRDIRNIIIRRNAVKRKRMQNRNRKGRRKKNPIRNERNRILVANRRPMMMTMIPLFVGV